MFPQRLVFILITTLLINASEGESTVSPGNSTVNSTTAAENTDVQPTDLLPNKTICGISSYFDQFPWTALIKFKTGSSTYTLTCGGMLINKRYVLTSIICPKILTNIGISPSVVVRLGEYNIKTDPDCIKSIRGVKCAPSPIDIDVEEQILDERSVFDVESNEIAFDIALFRLKKEVEFTETVRPICLPTTPEELSRTYVDQKLTVAGWGNTEVSKRSDIKRKIKIPITDREACKSKYNESKLILDDGQFCAGGEEGRCDCTGDQGNPLMVATVDENARVHWHAVGMVSVGPRTCGAKDWPGIFTNISTYIPWILKNLRP